MDIPDTMNGIIDAIAEQEAALQAHHEHGNRAAAVMARLRIVELRMELDRLRRQAAEVRPWTR